jgi:hypothetical protein
MSVILFHCPRCNIYTTDATVRLYVSATLDPQRGMLRVSDDTSLPEGYRIPLEDVVESLCPECSGPGHNEPMELVVLDKCPHRWGRWRTDSWGKSHSTCLYCGEDWKGETRYVTEFSE